MAADDILTEEDWTVLIEVLEIMKLFFDFIKYFEGCEPHFCEVIPSLYYLLDYL